MKTYSSMYIAVSHKFSHGQISNPIQIHVSSLVNRGTDKTMLGARHRQIDIVTPYISITYSGFTQVRALDAAMWTAVSHKFSHCQISSQFYFLVGEPGHGKTVLVMGIVVSRKFRH